MALSFLHFISFSFPLGPFQIRPLLRCEPHVLLSVWLLRYSFLVCSQYSVLVHRFFHGPTILPLVWVPPTYSETKMGALADLEGCGRREELAGSSRRKDSPRVPCSNSSSNSSSRSSRSNSVSSIAGRRRDLSRSQRRWPRCHQLITFVVFATTIALRGRTSASSNPMELNGGSCLAMAGKGCVALAVDRRFGLEGQLVSTDAKRVLKVFLHHKRISSRVVILFMRGLEVTVLSVRSRADHSCARYYKTSTTAAVPGTE